MAHVRAGRAAYAARLFAGSAQGRASAAESPEHRTEPAPVATQIPATRTAPSAKTRGRRAALGALALLVVAALAAGLWRAGRPRAPAVAEPQARYVGSGSCRSCHTDEYARWAGSHHAKAMAEASSASVRGDFRDATLTVDGVTSHLRERDGRYVVETVGPDGRDAEFPVKYTFGVAPLQQYLVELPGGRLQALSVAWDARPVSAGGQRWFDLAAGQRLKPGDPLHWTGAQQNWNFMCADCHSTALRKNFDPVSGMYRTTWSEISVGCEACHGPGSRHLAWAERAPAERALARDAGLTVALDERHGIRWARAPGQPIAARSAPRRSARELDVCAQCHARRSQVSEDYVPGRPPGDAYRIALLDPPLYESDGQMRDEVYNHGSFLQSRMQAAGVTCSDCHEPHGGALRAEGNGVCAQCHAPAVFDAPAHTHHAADGPGGRCVACHMPTRTYMGVDVRHDHSLRVPRPRQTVELGVPNACGQCHGDRSPGWAAQTVARWYGHEPEGYQGHAAAFAAAERGAPEARAELLALAGDPARPAIVRATALERLAGDPGTRVTAQASAATRDPDELVRRAAVSVLAGADPDTRLRALAPLAADPVRVVRMDAARALAALPDGRLSAEERASVARGLEDYLAAQRYGADRAEAHLNLGGYYRVRGDLVAAAAEYDRALALDRDAVPAIVALAELDHGRGDEAAARARLTAALQSHPRAADLELAAGLACVRTHDVPAALAHLRAAADQAPERPSFAVYYAVGLHSYGQPQAARRVLEAATRRHPADRPTLKTLVSFELADGHVAAARQWVERLIALAEDDPESQALAESLR